MLTFATRIPGAAALSAPTPRKQARQARAQVTRNAIIEATAHILDRQGSDGMTTNHIAKRAGVSIGSLYQYFPNKDAILAELIRDKRARLLAAMQAAEQDTRDAPPETALRVMIQAALIWQTDRPTLSREVEYLAPRLSMQAETEDLTHALAQSALPTVRRFVPQADLREARDVVAIVKGLITAGLQARDPGGDLVIRAERAVLGYLREIRLSEAGESADPDNSLSVV